MKKSLILSIFVISLVLTGCQTETREAPAKIRDPEADKAATASNVRIIVPDENAKTETPVSSIQNAKVTIDGMEIEGLLDVESLESSVSANDISIITNKKGVVISETGMLPTAITATVGETLMLYNETDKQVDLYTTAAESEECAFLDATIEIPGKDTKEYPLDKTGSCRIINQLNTDQTVDLTVE